MIVILCLIVIIFHVQVLLQLLSLKGVNIDGWKIQSFLCSRFHVTSSLGLKNIFIQFPLLYKVAVSTEFSKLCKTAHYFIDTVHYSIPICNQLFVGNCKILSGHSCVISLGCKTMY